MQNARKVETDKLLEMLKEEAQYILKSKKIPETEKHYIMVTIERMVNNIKQYRGEER